MEDDQKFSETTGIFFSLIMYPLPHLVGLLLQGQEDVLYYHLQ